MFSMNLPVYCSSDIVRCDMPKKIRQTEGDGSSALGRTIKERRKSLHLTQRIVAGEAGITQGYLSQVESGQVNELGASVAQKLARILKLPIDSLLGEARAEDVDASLDAFLASELAEGVTKDERDALRRAAVPWGKPTIRTWYHVLESIRSVRRQ